MKIYANELLFDAEKGVDPIFDQINLWLSLKTKKSFSISKFGTGDSQFSHGEHRIHASKCEQDGSLQFALRYSHPDDSVRHRQWITEIGIHKPDDKSPVAVSVHLRTHEESPIAGTAPIATTRPWLVEAFITKCRPHEETVGLKVQKIGKSQVPGLAKEIASLKRAHSIILISANADGHYPVDVAKLQSYCVGLAVCVQLEPALSAELLRNNLPPGTAAWDGSISVLFPAVKSDRRTMPFIPVQKFKPADIASAGDSLKSKILEAIVHRTNPNFSSQIITNESIQLAILKAGLESKRKDAEKDAEAQKEYVQLLEEQAETLERKVEELKMDVAKISDDLAFEQFRVEEVTEEKNEEIRSIQAKCEALETTFARKREKEVSGVPEVHSDAIASCLARKASLEQILTVLSMAYPGRLVILESAWKSARESSDFKYPEVAWDVLNKMATAYWEFLSKGKGGDAEAKKLFGGKFVARDSEVVENNIRAQKLRTFIYNGNPLRMFKHLRHGVKDNTQDTLRVYFEWDSENRKLVIGHCGRHLDHN